jgi:hypothetical protein
LAAVAVWVWVVGSAIVPAGAAAERVVSGVFAALALGWAAMAAGDLGAAPLGRPVVVGVIAAGVAIAAAAVRRPQLLPSRPAALPLAVAMAAATLVALPMARLSPSALWPGRGDMLWHSGWTKQLLHGSSTPGGIYGASPNDYPWLYHALAALVAAPLPGGVETAIIVIQALGLAAGGCGMWLLAQRLGLGTRAASWSVLLVLAGGGFGWIWQHHPAAVFKLTGHGLGPYHGDLEVANAMSPGLGNLPPLLPRDLGLMLAPGVVWLALRPALPRRRWGLAGAATGLVFLVAPLSGAFCALWIAVLAIIERARAVWVAAVAAAGVSAVWLAPLAVNYHRYGGLHSVTHLAAVNPTVFQAVVALGVALPLGVGGLVVARGDPHRRELLAVALTPAVLTLAVAVAGAGGNLLGTPALLRWLRYLPFVAVGLAAPAGLAADALVDAAARRARVAAGVAAVALAFAAVASTGLAMVAVARTPYPTPLVCSSMPISTGDTVAVVAQQPFADYLAYEIFGRTGASLWYVKALRVKVRYRDWLRQVRPGEQARHAAQLAFAAGGPPPPGVKWLFVPTSQPASRRLTRVATCSYRGVPLAMLRAPVGGG